jgi:predicted DNA-binding transcriptional regulator AlpA
LRIVAFMSAARLLDTTQAAESLGLSARTLEGLRQSGRGPRYAKLGRRTMYTAEDLAAWVGERKRTSTKEEDPM